MIDRQFSVSGAPDLEVRIPAGRVEIVEGDSATVKVSVETKDPDFVVEQRGNLIIASSSSSRDTGWASKTAHVVIEAPARSSAEISTASANITVRAPVHKLTIKTASGNVTLGTADSVVIKTASGDATIDSVDKALRFTTASGDLEVNGHLSGTAAVVTVSGDVDIADSDAVLELKTVSGSAIVQRFVGKATNFRTVSGDLEVAVPPGTKLHLEADTRSGRVDLPTDPPPVTEIRREMSIKARLVSGNVTIKRSPD